MHPQHPGKNPELAKRGNGYVHMLKPEMQEKNREAGHQVHPLPALRAPRALQDSRAGGKGSLNRLSSSRG